MLCHRCGSQVPDNSESCATCGLKLSGAAAGAGPRRRGASVEAPYKPGDLFAKRYAIREVLGPGPVGHVFRALDQEMDVEVALKIINPRLVQMPEERTQFSFALRQGKKLSHPTTCASTRRARSATGPTSPRSCSRACRCGG
ncbi:hypothetical protein F0U59_39340 [Archangium gephyra]|nr:hypothetical protein F0U59_39340 [Archangium gephyra]